MEKEIGKIFGPYYKFRKGSFYIEEIEGKKIVERFGTPIYVYSYNFLINQINKIKSAFSNLPVKICFSVKSNSNLSILKVIKENGLGADVVSEGELRKALIAGFSPSDIVFAGVGKKEEEIAFAIRKNIFCFNIENEEEIEIIEKFGQKFRKKVNVNLRLNLDIDVNTHHYIKTSRSENKFGIDLELAEKILKRKFNFVEIKGIHFHLGSQIKEVLPYIEAIKKVKRFCEKTKFHPEILDIGGGFGIPYNIENEIQPIEEFGRKITEELKNFNLKTIILEPGRFIVGNSGVLITKVLYVKKKKTKNFIIVDAGMNDLIRPSLYGSFHLIYPLCLKVGKKIKFDVVGPICETSDYLGKDREFSENIKRGDFLVVMSAGAYGFSMSSNYNTRLRIPEVIVKGKKIKIIRERETFFYLFKPEIFKRKNF
ncbi:MAG: diaminopimelate decarboxylase [Candidatus Omnitrophica bacterium]|nr:diaminopimelate decarboxylase [Candidatus Omnitrophota bacterium]MCM8801746.1 diaminopimelate decarboxylase [Candidatus Omnitrophota bacterium]